ncbi:MAG: ribosome maturation factor RimP [Acidobacteriota bacterium]
MARLTEELMARLHRLARSEGMELVAVEVGGTPRRPRLRLVLDRREGSVTLHDCEIVSRQASLLLDEADPFPGPYTLEVSSPGLDRKLYGPEDYERFRGQAVRVKMRPGVGGQRVVEGFLVAVRAGVIHLRTASGEEIGIPEEGVFEVRLDPFLEERLTKQGERARRRERERDGAKRERR